ncbi:hypothetical protein ACOCJ7_06680 [Knoellia sp. CPCC 206453]|uniref:hypothetical protein n=1 Tax=Knoellia pratensis TaxID=3404796 RepID=UPI00361466B2
MKVPSVLVGLAVGSSLALGACTSDAPDTTARSPSAAPMDWQRVPLPTGLSAVTLAATDETVLVGAYGPARPRPHLLSGTGSGPWQDVPLTPRSPYAFEARWFQIIARDGHIDAIAGARGGAHGNYRWTTWTGTTTGVAEQEQPFGVFGSYGAGDLAGMAYAGGSPVILGAWQSERTGLDIATWTRTGARWARQPSTGTPLGSTPDELAGATAITSGGDGLVLSGSLTRLEPGSVTVEPAVWTSPDADGPWTREDLPHATPEKGSALAEAHAATCTPHQCLVTGTVGGRLFLWEVGGNTTRNPSGIPDIEVTQNASVLAPISLEGKDVFVVPSRGGSVVLQRSGETWSVGDGPRGAPVSAVLLGDEVWVVTTDAHGTGTLWRARVA